jgi:Mn-dependent DtxR family transcriptional regulator
MKMTPTEKKVYDYIKDHKPESQADIARALEMWPQDVNTYVNTLRSGGHIELVPAQYKVIK